MSFPSQAPRSPRSRYYYMAFTIPSFPLICGIIHGGAVIPGGPYDLEPPCNLTWGRRVGGVSPTLVDYLAIPNYALGQMTLLLPALTDIRDIACGGGFDSVECPVGSGRWYYVLYVDDIGKGFPNEHRAALLTKVALLAPPWPAPIP